MKRLVQHSVKPGVANLFGQRAMILILNIGGPNVNPSLHLYKTQCTHFFIVNTHFFPNIESSTKIYLAEFFHTIYFWEIFKHRLVSLYLILKVSVGQLKNNCWNFEFLWISFCCIIAEVLKNRFKKIRLLSTCKTEIKSFTQTKT